MFNKTCTYITFKFAVKHRQLGYGYLGVTPVRPAEGLNNSGCSATIKDQV